MLPEVVILEGAALCHSRRLLSGIQLLPLLFASAFQCNLFLICANL